MSYNASFYAGKIRVVLAMQHIQSIRGKTHVQTACDIRVLDQVVRRQERIVRLDDRIRDLWTREDREIAKHSYRLTISPTVPQHEPKEQHSRSGYSSRILLNNNAPSPLPVPPPKLCNTWNPCKLSDRSAWPRAISKIGSISSAPSV